MNGKILILHDGRVYDQLRKMARFNRRVTVFALVSTMSIAMLTKIVDTQRKEINKLKTKIAEDI